MPMLHVKVTIITFCVSSFVYIEKNWVYRGIVHVFLLFALKHRVWVLVRTGSNMFPRSMF